VEGISQTLLGLLGIGVIVAVAIVLGSLQGRVRAARSGAAMGPLAQVIGGAVSEGRLRGTYHGYSVEAWPDRRDPAPSSSFDDSSSGREVNVFNIKLVGVPGRQYWYCRSQPRLLGAPDFEFSGVIGLGSALEGRFAKFAGYPPPDAALEERLRAAGLMGELARLGVRDSGYLPVVSFAPPPSNERLQQLARAALPAAAHAQLGQIVGELQCEMELGAGRVPTPEGFRELLDTALRVAHINAEANAGQA